MKHGPELTVDALVEMVEHLEELCKAEHQRANDACNYHREEDAKIDKLFPGYRQLLLDFTEWVYGEEGLGDDELMGGENPYSFWRLMDLKYPGLRYMATLFMRFLDEHRED